jgi:iron complex outermembrane recepter protein
LFQIVNMKKIFAIVLIFAGLSANAQTTGKLTASIVNEQSAALEGATVELITQKDSSLTKTALTDKAGTAVIEKLKPGAYLLKVSMAGYGTGYSSPFSIDENNTEINLQPLTLKLKPSSELQGVTVTSRKPFIQRLSDRIVVNVESSIISAGSSALDVLERSPGVTVDQNDAIALRGRQGVIIMVDGKPSPMSAADLANYLRGLPSSAIERIEIITNPSAKYDAAGNSGIIDIRMKKDQRLGTNGTFTAGYGQGVYPKANTGITFNHRNKKVNLFGNYNYAYRKNMNHLFLNRNFFENKVFTGYDDKDNSAQFPLNSHNARFGADFFPSKKTIVGFVVSSNFFHNDGKTDNHVVEYDANRVEKSTFHAQGGSDDHNKNIVGNINLKQTIGSKGKELTADIDYGQFINHSLSTMFTSYTGAPGKPNYLLNGDQDRKLVLRTAKVDYVNPLKEGARFEAGFKSSYVSSDNDAKFRDMSILPGTVDSGKTNTFFYDEYNNAGYVNYSKEFKKFSMQFGLRTENTSVKTHQVRNSQDTAFHYLEFFPSAFFNYKINPDRTLGVSVSRRIDRPGYQQLNPFLFLIDVTTYSTGAPGLKPQMTWSYELSLTQKQLNFTLGYSRTKDIQNTAILRYRDAFPKDTSKSGNITVQIPVNLSSSDYFGLTIAAPVRVNSWWNMVNNANIYYNHFNGKLAGTSLNNGAPAADLRTNNTFTFKKGWVAEFSGTFSSGGRYGYMVSDPQWGVGAGLQKSVLKNNGTVRFNVTDIFWTNLPKAVITYDNYIEHWHAQRESRVASLNFTYRFGNNKVAAARRRQAASQEEIRRAGGQ